MLSISANSTSLDWLLVASSAMPCLVLAICCGCSETKVDKPVANVETPAVSSSQAEEQHKTEVPANSTWPLFRGDAQATGYIDGKLPNKLEILWEYTVAGDDPGIEASAVVADGLVFVANMDDAIEAVDLAVGKRKWICKTDIGFAAPPAVKDGRVFIGDLDGVFYAIDAVTGAIDWKFATKAEINSSANFYKDLVLVGSQDNHLYALDAKSGKVRWKYKINDQVQCMPTVIGDRAFLAGCDARLHLIDLTSGKSSGSVLLDNPTNCTPAAQGNFVYLGTQANSFFAIDWKKKEVAWKYVNSDRQLPYESSAAVTEKLVLVGGRDKMVKALDRTTGKEVWKFKAKAGVNSSPVVVGERVYFGTDRGRLLALNLSDGSIAWEHETGGSFAASPAVAMGRLIIGNTDGTLYCFGEK